MVGFLGISETAEEDSAVSIRLRKQNMRFQWDREILYDTAEAFLKTIIGSHFLSISESNISVNSKSFAKRL
jgi:hypothetical protein